MPTPGWIALLRGINVGGHNMVAMAGLRDLFEECGCTSVTSYIQSGNVLFARPDVSDRAVLAAQLQDAVLDSFGARATIVLRTFDELRAVAGTHPFGTQTAQTFVTFLASEPAGDGLQRLKAADSGADRFVICGSDVYLHYPNGVRGARLSGAALERLLGVPGTSRNWRTVVRLADLTMQAAPE